jgi:hypothetical protein
MIKKFDQFNESVRDMMKPKSEEEIKRALMTVNPDELLLLLYENDEFQPFFTGKIKERLMSLDPFEVITNIAYYNLQDLFTNQELIQILNRLDPEEKLWQMDKFNFNKEELEQLEESVKDMLKPKSREDINKDIRKQFFEHEWDEIGWENLVKYWFNGDDKFREWLEKQFVKPELDRFKDFIKSEYHNKQIYYSNPEFGNIMKNSKLFSTRFSRFFSKNESVKDMLKPKSKEELKALVDKETSLLQKSEMISRLELEDMFTRDELDKINSVEYEIDIEKQFGKYDVTYSFIADDTFTVNSGIKEITGTLMPYNSGRSTDYKFETDWFTDAETEAYWDENWEEIEDRILDEFNNR